MTVAIVAGAMGPGDVPPSVGEARGCAAAGKIRNSVNWPPFAADAVLRRRSRARAPVVSAVEPACPELVEGSKEELGLPRARGTARLGRVEKVL